MQRIVTGGTANHNMQAIGTDGNGYAEEELQNVIVLLHIDESVQNYDHTHQRHQDEWGDQSSNF